MTTSDAIRRAGLLLSVGVRGAHAGDPDLEADLELCAAVGVGSVVLFDVDVARYRGLIAEGVEEAEARCAAERNVVSPAQVQRLCAHLRLRLGEGLVILVDQEGGRVARLRPERGFASCLPAASEFARLDRAARRRAALAQARELVALGIDGNLAPVVDLGVRPDGPLAAAGRTFGADPEVVIECARDVIAAHREVGVATCLKHFPGLGSADLDTHEGQPVLGQGYDPTLELAPFRALLSDLPPPEMVMAAHAVWAAVDPDRPASASAKVLRGVLRAEMGFEGVIATDSLDMGGAGGSGSSAAARDALVAGADLLMDAVNLGHPGVPQTHPARAMAEAVADAVESGAVEGGWNEIARRAARVRALRRR